MKDGSTTGGNIATLGPAARAVKLSKIYGAGDAAVRAIDDVSIEVTRGQFTAIMGASGSGKSTLLHCMAGLDKPTHGQVFIAEVDLTVLKDRALTALRRERVGFIFQAYNLLPTLNASENIELPMKIGGRRPDAAWLQEVIAVLGLTDRLNHKPAELSGGQQQRVAAARALAGKPDIIFADEPTGNLDSRSGAELLSFMRRSVDEFGQTILMVTHDPVAAGNTDRVIFLGDGKVVDELSGPSSSKVLDKMKQLGA